MEVTQDIKLNINDTGDRYVVTVKQGDTGRILNVTMMDDQEELTIPSTATVSVRVLKSDGTSVDDTATVSDGKALVEITEQMTAVAGYAKADVSVASDGKIVSTATFLLKVGEIPLGVEIVSQNEFTQLSELIASASAYETRIGDLEETLLTLSWTSGAYIATDGTITSNNVWYYTEQYYPIKAIESINIPLWHLASCIAYYDADKTFVGYNEGTGRYPETSEVKTSFDSIANAVYVRFCTETRSINDFELTLITPYDAFVQTHPLYGKKVAVIGDSMVKGDYVNASQVWLTLLSQMTGAITYNYGVNGVNISNHDHNSNHGICITYADMAAGMDYVIVFGGTNDAYRGFALGDAGSTDDLTFNGALNELLDGLLTKYPAAKIGFISPYKNAYTNRYGNFNDYFNAIVDRCNERGIPVYDNVRGGGIGWDNSARTAVLTKGDNCHLSPEGHAFVVDRYIEFIQSMDNSGQSTTEIDNKADAITISKNGQTIVMPDSSEQIITDMTIDIEGYQPNEGNQTPDNPIDIIGYSSIKIRRSDSNILQFPYYHESGHESNGITFSLENYTIKANGTNSSSAVASFYIERYFQIDPEMSYTFSGCSDGSSSTYRITLDLWDSTKNPATDSYNTRLYNANGSTTIPTGYKWIRIVIYIYSGYTAENVQFNPKLIPDGATDDSSYTWLEDYKRYSVSLGETVYGGTLNLGTGILTIDKEFITLDGSSDENISMSSGRIIYRNDALPSYADLGYSNVPSEPVGILMCNQLPEGDHSTTPTGGNQVILLHTTSHFLQMYIQNITTEEEARAWFAENPLTVVYKTPTSRTKSIASVSVETLHGTTVLTADSGSMSLDYKADTKLYIDNKFAELRALLS